MLRLSERKEDRERERGAVGRRPFKLDLENRFLMLLVYYRLYITYTLAGFYLIWMSTIAEISRRLKVLLETVYSFYRKHITKQRC